MEEWTGSRGTRCPACGGGVVSEHRGEDATRYACALCDERWEVREARETFPGLQAIDDSWEQFRLALGADPTFVTLFPEGVEVKVLLPEPPDAASCSTGVPSFWQVFGDVCPHLPQLPACFDDVETASPEAP